MDNDAEKRIAELERQLAEAHSAAAANRSALTPEDVRDVAFSKPPLGKRGYNEDEVDAFLEVVETTLRDPASSRLTAADVHNVVFAKPPRGKRGYNADEVDAFLELIEQQIKR